MKLFRYHVCWRYSSENFVDGVVRANSREEALQKLKNSPLYSHCIDWDVCEEINPNQEIVEIYTK
jgi:type II secretory pathway component PulF